LLRTIEDVILYVFVKNIDHDTTNYATFEALRANIKVLWDVTTCRLDSYNFTRSHIPENLNNV